MAEPPFSKEKVLKKHFKEETRRILYLLST